LDALRLLKTFPTRREQDDALQAAAMLAKSGAGFALDKPLPLPLAEAARFWLIHHPGAGAMPTIEEALAAYLEHKQTRREGTKGEIRHKIGRFAKSFPNTLVSEITSDMLDGWLTDNLTPPNRKRYLNVYRTFWKFLGEKFKLETDPAARIMLPALEGDQSEVTAYTVEEARRILHAASAAPLASKLVPVIALGMFAGLRPTEVQGLDWADVSVASTRKFYFDEYGRCSETIPLKYWGWFMQAPLLFDSTGGVFFDTKTNEGTKLTQLGSEGRSTSTTITAFPNVRRDYERTFQDYLFYRTIADLRRSWRIVLPSLEQCGLLVIEYLDLDEVAAADAAWADVPLVSSLSATDRRDFLATILDLFRLEFALHSENFLTPSRLKEQEKHFREKLKAPWTLDAKEELREPYVIRLDRLHRSAKRFSKSMGPASSLGKYIKHFANQRRFSPDLLRGQNYIDFILRLMSKLEAADYLFKQTARSRANVEVPVYRLRIEKIVWRLGNGETVKSDVIKRRSYKELDPKPNLFFRRGR